MSLGNDKTSITEILETIWSHESRRPHSVNLVASENLLSPAASAALASDLGHRYCIPPADQRPASIWDYPNQYAVRHIEHVAQRLACEAFDAQAADVRPLSGNNAAYILIKALMRAGESMASVPAACGGHFATWEICRREAVNRHDIPYNWEAGAIDVEATAALCEEQSVKLLFLDASMQPFPHPVKDLRSLIPESVTIAYDASHTMGIIGGGGFQNPLLEGADIVQGSTHKSLFGPQKGLFAFAGDGEVHDAVHDTITPLFVSNSHPHHIAALAVALQEVVDFGQEYAACVVSNARALASDLHASNGRVLFPERNFTDCHQFVWAVGSRAEAERQWLDLEAAGLHVNLVTAPFHPGEFGFRIGTSEATRRGMGLPEMRELAGLFGEICAGRGENAAEAVARLSSRFPNLYFGYDESGAPLGTTWSDRCRPSSVGGAA
jgi:glycine hydroxymethyltransferase